VCFPACSSDADCAGLICNTLTRTCADPEAYLGSQCQSDADCRNLGPGGTCLITDRTPSIGYCTVACQPDPSDTECVTGYATLPDGGPAAVRLKLCRSDQDCQFSSSNTCNYVPATSWSFCTLRCFTDADCPDGACDPDSGHCHKTQLWAHGCAISQNCATGVCEPNVFSPGTTCSSECAYDADCPGGSVCVDAPPYNSGLEPNTGLGFCAPECSHEGGACPELMTRCLGPEGPAEPYAFGHASSPFCWP
jgi:hypothetical protein